jgi:importin subunit alpha-1
MCQDIEASSNALWILSRLSDGSDDRIQYCLDTGCLPRILELLAHPSREVNVASIRVIGNIVSGNEMQTQAVVDLNGLPILRDLMGMSLFSFTWCDSVTSAPNLRRRSF